MILDHHEKDHHENCFNLFHLSSEPCHPFSEVRLKSKPTKSFELLQSSLLVLLLKTDPKDYSIGLSTTILSGLLARSQAITKANWALFAKASYSILLGSSVF